MQIHSSSILEFRNSIVGPDTFVGDVLQLPDSSFLGALEDEEAGCVGPNSFNWASYAEPVIFYNVAIRPVRCYCRLGDYVVSHLHGASSASFYLS